MDIIDLLKSESEKFNKGLLIVNQKRRAWESFEQRAYQQLNSFCVEARTQKLFENLYVTKTDKHRDKHNYVTFFFGNHPIGMQNFGKQSKGKFISEGGCALHYTQGPSGDVICVFYPFSSDITTPPQRLYTYRIFRSPESIKDNHILSHVAILFSLAHYSSYAGVPNCIDCYRYIQLRGISLWTKSWNQDWFIYVQKLITQLFPDYLK